MFFLSLFHVEAGVKIIMRMCKNTGGTEGTHLGDGVVLLSIQKLILTCLIQITDEHSSPTTPVFNTEESVRLPFNANRHYAKYSL